MAHHARSKKIYLEQFKRQAFEEGGAGFKVRDRTSGRMKGRFEWWLGCLEGFKAPRSLELVVGNPNYGSPATSFASLAPLCVARLLFQYILATNLPLRWQFHRLHGKLLTGDMSVGMRWLFMAWGGGVLNAQCLVGWGRVAQCRTAHFLHNASVATNLTNFFNNMSLKPGICNL